MSGAHRRDGLFVLAGPGVRPIGQVATAEIVDVLPTLLALAGEAVPSGLDGRPIADLLEVPVHSEADRLAAGDPSPAPFDDDETEELLARLAALGYLEADG